MSLVLIAEDEEAMLEVFSDVVEDLGHRALRAHDGEEALLLARTEAPDLVVSDHMMPRRTGVELLRALRSDARLSVVPFVLLSAARPQGLEAADAFLPKPVDLSVFESAVKTALSNSTSNGDHRRLTVSPGSSRPPTASVRDDMLNWVAHELKTPLGAARMTAQLLQRRLAHASPAEAKAAATIIRQVDKMNALVTSILDAARLSESKVTLELAPTDFVAFLREEVQDWRELTPDTQFILEGDDEPLVLVCDEARVRHILNNLLSNAVKYGGRSRPVKVKLTRAPGLVEVSVQDFGQGIAASELPSIFDRFHRGSAAGGRGHGLGLYIASALARLHGGSLSAHSVLGEGSTFCLRLPLTR